MFTKIFKTTTLEQWRQLSNEISSRIGANENLDNLLTTGKNEFIANSGQALFATDLDFDKIPQATIDNVGGYIILKNNPSIPASFLQVNNTLFQDNGFSATIISASPKKILISNKSGEFDASLPIKAGADEIAAANVVNLIIESYDLVVLDVRKNGAVVQQGLGFNEWHAAPYVAFIELTGLTSVNVQNFIEGQIAFQGTTLQNATWVGTILFCDQNVLRLKTSTGTFSDSQLIRVTGSSDTILGANHGDIQPATGAIEFNTPLAENDGVVIRSINLVDSINELQSDIGNIDNLLTVNKTVVGAINEHDIELGEITEGAMGTPSANTVSTAIKKHSDEIGSSFPLQTSANTLSAAANELKGNIGNITSLNTTAKNNLVAATNELKGNIGSSFPLQTSANTLSAATNELKGNIGNITSLNTTAKNNLVAATNELKSDINLINNKLGNVEEIDLDGISEVVSAINALNTSKLNLTDSNTQTINSDINFSTGNVVTFPTGSTLDVSGGSLIIGGGGASLDFDTAFINLVSGAAIQGLSIQRTGNNVALRWNEGITDKAMAWQVVGLSENGSTSITSSLLNFYNAKNLLDNTGDGITLTWNASTQKFKAAVNNTVIRTTGNQTLGGTKTFTSTIVGSINGNAGTATTLQTPRTINGTAFNGSANIITANWGTIKTLTVGLTGKSVNGSADVSWSLSEIGAIPATEKAAANGVATLDSNGKVPLNQMSDTVLGQVEYKGTWNAATNTPNLPTTPTKKGDYYVVSVGATRFGLEFDVGDWIISNGSAWEKVNNTDAVRTVNGKLGDVVLTKADVGLGNVDNTSDLNKPISTATQTALNGKENAFSKNTAFNKNFGTTAGTVTEGNDTRLSNEREWTASTITQAEAEAGTATTRRAFTAQRARQAIASYAPSKTGTGASGTWGISITGNAATATNATTLQTSRTINGTAFNGSANITTANWGTARTLTIGSSGKSVNGSGNISWSHAEIDVPTRSGSGASGVWDISITGFASTAGTATTLQTSRTINGTLFNGSANITTANWGTARTLTIGSSGKSVNGSGNISWSHAEIDVPTRSGSGASGTWAINITGNAATATNATTVNNGVYTNANNVFTATNFFNPLQAFRGGLEAYEGSDQRFDGVRIRGRNAGTSTHRVILEPAVLTGTRTLTLPNASGTVALTNGTGASGTWGINITGNAAKATNVNNSRDNGNLQFWTGTQAQYNAIGTKSATTLYFIVG